MTEAVLTSHGTSTSHLCCLQIRIIPIGRKRHFTLAFNMPRIRCSASTWLPKRKNVASLVVTVAERITLTNTNTNHHVFQVKPLKNQGPPPIFPGNELLTLYNIFENIQVFYILDAMPPDMYQPTRLSFPCFNLWPSDVG